MSTWSVDLCDNWVRIGQIQGTAFTFQGVDRFNEVGQWELTFPDAAPSWTYYTNAAGDTVPYNPRDVDTVRLVEDGKIRFAGFVGDPANNVGGAERRRDAAGVHWRMNGPDLWEILRRRVAFPVPATANPSAWASSHDVNTGSGSNVLASYIADNLGSSAIAGRTVDGLTVDDTAAGATGTWSARLQTIYELARRILTDVELTIRWTVDFAGAITASLRETRDLSEEVVLSDQDDLVAIRTRYFAPRSTWVVAGGDGTGTGRRFAYSTSAATGLDRRERFVDVASLTQDDEVFKIAAATRRIDMAAWMVTGEIADAVSQRVGFGRSIFPGDSITIQALRQRFILPVASTAWEITPARQVIRTILGDPVPDALKHLLRQIDDLTASAQNGIA